MLKTNEKHLVEMAVQGKIGPAVRSRGWTPDQFGKIHAVPGVGSIVYNVKVGDPAFGWKGDHIEPGVSTVVDENKRADSVNAAYNFLACMGNEARVVTGDAKGAKGVVVGHHGGIEHVMIDFDDKTLDKLTLDDKILIRAFGQGLELTDYPDVKVYNLAPSLLHKMGIKAGRDGTLQVPVTAMVPGELMGSGLGHPDPVSGDYDITTMDEKVIRKHNLDKIRFGDFVALMDCDNTYGRHFLSGAVTIGIVVHSDCIISGHGPGVATLLSCRTPLLKPMRSADANIGQILKIGRFRKPPRTRK
ncbi:MAG TPA: DUF4438 domain-containing protein [bacterium]|nr:DUF4438 domain-containing protein [bacterium]HQL61133.1 DUF4438 domain-containing protein [bacterium]